MIRRIIVSSGHGKFVRGAKGILDEVDEARLVVEDLAYELLQRGAYVATFHDDESHTQAENLHRIVSFHNEKSRDLDVSVHFNAFQETSRPMGTECLFRTQEALAMKVAEACAISGGLINRGSKYRDNLYFLNETSAPAILIEVCFVDSKVDAEQYQWHREEICKAIAEAIVPVIIQKEEPSAPTA